MSDPTVDPELIRRLRRFQLLRNGLDYNPALLHRPHLLCMVIHQTTNGLARFVWQHHMGETFPESQGKVDFIDLWQRLDRESRAEMIAYLQEEF